MSRSSSRSFCKHRNASDMVSRDEARVICKPGKVTQNALVSVKKSTNFCCGTEKAKVVARKASISSISDVAVAVVETNTVTETVIVDKHHGSSSSHGGGMVATTKTQHAATTTILAGDRSHSSSDKKVGRRSSSSLKKVKPHKSSSSLKEHHHKKSSSSSDKAAMIAAEETTVKTTVVAAANQGYQSKSHSHSHKAHHSRSSSDEVIVVAQQIVTHTEVSKRVSDSSSSNHHGLRVEVSKAPSHSVRSSSSRSHLKHNKSSSSSHIQARTSPHVPQGVATKKSKGLFGCCSPDAAPGPVTKLVRKVTETNIGRSRSSESYKPFAKSHSEGALLHEEDNTVVIHGKHGDIVANEHWVAGEDSDGNQVMVKATEKVTVAGVDRSNSHSTCSKAKKHHKKRHVNEGFDGPLIMADSPRIVLTRTLCGKKGRSSSDEVDVVAVKTTTTTAVAVDTDGDNVADAFVYTEKTQTAVAVDTDGDNVADAVLVTEKNEAVVVAGRSSSSL